MKRFTAILLSLIMILSLSVNSFAYELDPSAWNEMRDDPDNCDPGKGVVAVTDMMLHVDRNGKTVTDLEGNEVFSKVREKVIQKYFAVMMGVPVNWDRVEYMEFEATLDLDEKITLGKQILVGRNGLAVGSENAELIVFDAPTHFHAASSGETEVVVYDFDGNELGACTAKARMISTGAFVVSTVCPRCGAEEEGCELHLMACGHYSCEVGREGHGAGDCGEFGHLNCDGAVHTVCSNCHTPLCSEEHGAVVCTRVIY